MPAKPRSHVKFSEEIASDPAHVKVQTVQSTEHSSDDESDESEDDAPEEEGVSNGKLMVEKEILKREELLKAEQKQLKEQRRKNDAFYKSQQQSKKGRTSEIRNNDTLDELPEEIFNKLEDDNKLCRQEASSKHINFNEEDYIPEIKKQLSDKKKLTLKKLRATSAKKGPVSVKVLSSTQLLSSMAPKREASIMGTKEKWLRRKALKRR
ncbi:hypothetical protein HG535_0F05870 [Zygotorulaspora mrakii]|uniref:Uncharacterized protein n=1 Tax=Zygotorulaspora mrakii TaxID=42260 RepID=A0A7H9B5U7_ZYGMR|nr:uncharacterized protein HG535_0F05870 [Zygotorulaspora mrakii]QLG74075.1 hypothetical protein HG535_0F05870 [Zygotorulaspora mrakii]